MTDTFFTRGWNKIMAQQVDFWANDIVYKDGPCVIVYDGEKYWLAAKMKGHVCNMPVSLTTSIKNLLVRNGYETTESENSGDLLAGCNWLNRQFNTKAYSFKFEVVSKYGGQALVV